ncbi:MAG: LytR C-terminal domain-containing protein [candidate division KSB1 bacterium]|nr:LytR C-terminal domain-containing protein [candidate division KSB1 bacterium]
MTWPIRPSLIFIYLLVAVNLVLIFSSAKSIFQKAQIGSIPPSSIKGDQSVLTLEIQNGCGVAGIAKRVETNLAGKPYQVIGTGNADHWNYEHTTLIDLKGTNKAAIERLRKEIGIDKEYVFQVKESGKDQVDARLIIGKDYSSLKIFNAQP